MDFGVCGRGGYMLCVIIESRKSRNDIGPPSSSLYVRITRCSLLLLCVYIRTRRGGLFFHFPFSLPTGIIYCCCWRCRVFIYSPLSFSFSVLCCVVIYRLKSRPTAPSLIFFFKIKMKLAGQKISSKWFKEKEDFLFSILTHFFFFFSFLFFVVVP